MVKLSTPSLLIFLCNALFTNPLLAQSEVMAWGNLTGIRVEGQLMEIKSSFRVVEKGWKKPEKLRLLTAELSLNYTRQPSPLALVKSNTGRSRDFAII